MSYASEAICPHCNDYLVFEDTQNPMGWTCDVCQTYQDGASHHCQICGTYDMCDACYQWQHAPQQQEIASPANNWASHPFWQIKTRLPGAAAPVPGQQQPAPAAGAPRPMFLGFDGTKATLNTPEEGKSHTYFKVNTQLNSNIVSIQHPTDPKYFSATPTGQITLAPVAAGQAPAQWEFCQQYNGTWCIYAYHQQGGAWLRQSGQDCIADCQDVNTAQQFDLVGAQTVPGCCLIM